MDIPDIYLMSCQIFRQSVSRRSGIVSSDSHQQFNTFFYKQSCREILVFRFKTAHLYGRASTAVDLIGFFISQFLHLGMYSK